MEEPLTLVVAVGIDRYSSHGYGDLRGARRDAEAVKEIFVSRGINPLHIKLLTNETATRSELLGALRVWTSRFRRTAPLKLLVFFAGHGVVVSEGGIATSVLLTHDSHPEDPTVTGITVSDFAKAVTRAKPAEAYFFIDACSVGGRPDDEASQMDFNLLAGIGRQLSFALFAAPGKPALEDDGPQPRGLFTQAVIHALSTAMPLSAAEVEATVSSELAGIGAPEPGVIMQGDIRRRPMDKLHGSQEMALVSSSPDTVARPEALQVVLGSLSPLQPLWLWGASGSGKSSLLSQLESFVDSTVVVVSIASQESGFELQLDASVQQVASDLCERLVELFPGGRPMYGGLSAVLSSIARDQRRTTVVIDHLDRLSYEDRVQFVALVCGAGLKYLILASQDSPPAGLPVTAVPVPRLSLTDVKRFCRQYVSTHAQLDPGTLLLLSEGSPLRLRTILAAGAGVNATELAPFLPEEERAALTAVSASQGFVDAEQYAPIMNVSVAALRSLITKGFIQLAIDRYQVHDSAHGLGLHQATAEDRRRALRYWGLELSSGLSLSSAARSVTILVTHEKPDDEALNIILLAVDELHLGREWSLLESLIGVVAAEDVDRSEVWVSTVLTLARCFVTAVKHEESLALLSVLENLDVLDVSSEQRTTYRLLKAESLWWMGEFTQALTLLEEVLAVDSERHDALLSRGIAYWFLGNWTEADRDFEAAKTYAGTDARTLGWAEVMLASSLGLRGLELVRVRQLFRDGIGRLTRVGDDVGVAIAWGNYGEISWKLGDFATADLQLRRALGFGEDVCGPQLILEIWRSRLESSLRNRGIWADETSEALAVTEELFDLNMGTTVKMQLWNTHCNLFLLRGDAKRAGGLLKELQQITAGNEEYHIYTLANASLFAIHCGDFASARADMASCIKLCRSGGNLLAKRQILDNLTMYGRNRSLDGAQARTVTELAQLWSAYET